MLTTTVLILVLTGIGFAALARRSGYFVSIPPRPWFDPPSMRLNLQMTCFMFGTIALCVVFEVIAVLGGSTAIGLMPTMAGMVIGLLLLAGAVPLFLHLMEEARLCGIAPPRIRQDR